MGGAEGCTDETVDGPVTEYACVERVADETVDEWDTEYVGIELVADETVDGRVTEYDCVDIHPHRLPMLCLYVYERMAQ